MIDEHTCKSQCPNTSISFSWSSTGWPGPWLLVSVPVIETEDPINKLFKDKIIFSSYPAKPLNGLTFLCDREWLLLVEVLLKSHQ